MAGAGTELGLDRSGNGNNFSASDGTLGSDQMLGSPTNNFSTWNPLARRAALTGRLPERLVQTKWLIRPRITFVL